MRLNKEAKDFMKGKFGAVTQVFLALLLSFSLGLMTALPSMAQESPQESASISPEGAEYHLDDPEDFISTKITWGIASNITKVTDDDRTLEKGLYNDYKVLDNTLLILNNYLKETLDNIQKRDKITAKELSETMKLEMNTSGTRLLNLHKKRLVRRMEEIRNGGRVWIYENI